MIHCKVPSWGGQGYLDALVTWKMQTQTFSQDQSENKKNKVAPLLTQGYKGIRQWPIN